MKQSKWLLIGLVSCIGIAGCGGGGGSNDTDTIDSANNDTQTSSVDHTYPKNAGPDKNPLKGWNGSWFGDKEETTVAFQYVTWETFEPTEGDFNYDNVEGIINREASKGRHLVLRLYCDWWILEDQGNCPDWLYEDYGVERKEFDGTWVTDYNHSAFIMKAKEAIQAFADRYDDDPRIYAIQLGMIGYWGEWHNAGLKDNGQFSIEDSTAQAILKAYEDSFDNKELMGRYPWREPLQSASDIGYHNDFFVADNGHSDEFDEAIALGDRELNGPIGGETPPRGVNAGVSDEEFQIEIQKMYDQRWGAKMIETGRYSVMAPGDYRPFDKDPSSSRFDMYKERYKEDYMELHRMMGYNYQIDVASFPTQVSPGSSVKASLMATNIGVAPMYYDWDVQFALLDKSDNPTAIVSADYDLRDALPSEFFTFETNFEVSGIETGDYRLAVRIIQPGANEAGAEDWKLDARNVYILFSNDLPVIDGQWKDNAGLVGGWSILGEVTVQ